ncbi:MAG TPA: DinB family protein [Blastocatellia bacterium]|nr:DinB family protein [Blastocatellia bacterium]
MSETDLLILQLEQAFDHRSWHGTNLFGSIRGIAPEQAAWRPGEGRHNVWEIIVHAAYWKYTVYRRLVGEARGSFPLRGSNWFPRPVDGSAVELKTDTRLLREFHDKLLTAVKQLNPRRLGERPPGSKFAFRDLIVGVAAHDLYHAGQVQLLKRLRQTSSG